GQSPEITRSCGHARVHPCRLPIRAGLYPCAWFPAQPRAPVLANVAKSQADTHIVLTRTSRGCEALRSPGHAPTVMEGPSTAAGGTSGDHAFGTAADGHRADPDRRSPACDGHAGQAASE